MSLFISLTIGFLVAVAVLQLLQRDIVRIVVGLYILWNAANLLLVAASALRGERAPFATGETGLADPLVQAFVLTGIVITFGFMACLITLLFWLIRSGESEDIGDYRRGRN
jgi:multicomponent Na+:H+ antiporter subunit C